MDSSALFAAILSATGAARELVRLALNEEIQLVISGDVITETRRNISRKALELEPLLDRLLLTVDFEVVPDPEKQAVWEVGSIVAAPANCSI